MRAGQIGGMAGGMEAEAFALARLSARAAGGMLLEDPGRRHTREHARGTTSPSAVGSYTVQLRRDLSYRENTKRGEIRTAITHLMCR